MRIDITEIGLNSEMHGDKEPLGKDDVPQVVWDKAHIVVGNIKDQVIYRPSYFIGSGLQAPCPLGGCKDCFFGSPCIAENNGERNRILKHLFNGGEITWTT